MTPSAPISSADRPEITGTQCLIETADRLPAPNKRIFNRFDIVLFALCCLGLLIYLIESESIRYLALRLGVRH